MQLAEKLMLRSYHLMDYGWTPLSQNPCWRCCITHEHQRFLNIFIIPTFRSPAPRAARLAVRLSKYELLWSLNPGRTIQMFPGTVCDESGLCATIHRWLSRVSRYIAIYWDLIQTSGKEGRLHLVLQNWQWIYQNMNCCGCQTGSGFMKIWIVVITITTVHIFIWSQQFRYW